MVEYVLCQSRMTRYVRREPSTPGQEPIGDYIALREPSAAAPRELRTSLGSESLLSFRE